MRCCTVPAMAGTGSPSIRSGLLRGLPCDAVVMLEGMSVSSVLGELGTLLSYEAMCLAPRSLTKHSRQQEPVRSSSQVRDVKAPPVGFEPTHPAPEAGALSPELWGQRDGGKRTSRQRGAGHAAAARAICCAQALTSRS